MADKNVYLPQNSKIGRVHGSEQGITNVYTTVVKNRSINYEQVIASVIATYTNLFALTPAHQTMPLKIGAILHAVFSKPEHSITWNEAENLWLLPEGEYNVDVRIYGDAELNKTTTGIYRLLSNSGIEDQTHECIFPHVGNPANLFLMTSISIPKSGGWIQLLCENTGDGILQTNSSTKIRISRIK